MKENAEGVRKLWEKYKFVVLVVLIGAGLMLWPSGSGKSPLPQQEKTAERVDLQAEMERVLASISGVGQVHVLLTLDTDGERLLAQDTRLSYSGDTAAPEEYSRISETVLLDGSDGDGTLVTRMLYPTYRGALVVCQGGDRAEVRLAVTEAVAVLTGLSADRITVAKCQ